MHDEALFATHDTVDIVPETVAEDEAVTEMVTAGTGGGKSPTRT